jgi:glycosyltransferase involved in cell wall biosynthesis
VVIEAMATGALCIVTDYGAPGFLADKGRGVRVPLRPLDDLVQEYRAAMEACLDEPERHAQIAAQGHDYAMALYTWEAKAASTMEVYASLLRGDAYPSMQTVY